MSSIRSRGAARRARQLRIRQRTLPISAARRRCNARFGPRARALAAITDALPCRCRRGRDMCPIHGEYHILDGPAPGWLRARVQRALEDDAEAWGQAVAVMGGPDNG